MRKPHRFFVVEPKKLHKSDGAALVVVLALLVLLTGVVVAYLSRSNTELKVSTASVASSSADILVRSATEAIVAEIQQDIKEGSDLDGNIYMPKSALDMVLKSRLAQDDQAAVAGVETALPNLVRISRRATSQAAANRMISPGSSVASTVESMNKRSISPKRWNSHYLLPPATYPTDDDAPAIDPTPPTTFPVPHWVMVTSDGPTWISALDDTTRKKVVGRYAFAIYNEGGLLDVNVAGYPSIAAGTAVGKGSLAYADLTQLPLRNNTSLTQTLVDNLVGWRNKGLTGALGDFGGDYSFAIGQNGREAFHDEFVLREDSGHTKVKFAGDQRFLSRQALIKYWERAGLKMEALQYLTTFSRSLEQPSLLANAKIIPNWIQASNPSVAALTNANGEPFVQKRFSLRKLAWLTPAGPSGSGMAGIFKQVLEEAGFSEDEINAGTAANIAQYFGLTWNSGEWSYRPGPIRTLQQVQSDNEEPNFFELLKAAIPEGALRMGANNSSTGTQAYHDYQRSRDEDVDRAILQIGANIIDQYDGDSFPTRITYTPGAQAVTVVGIESLPYIYGTRQGLVMTTQPAATVAPTDPPAPGTVTNEGEAVSMLFPILWNPHFDNTDATVTIPGLVPAVRFSVSAAHPIEGAAGSGTLDTTARDDRDPNSSSTKAGTTVANITADSTALHLTNHEVKNHFINPVLIKDATLGEVSSGPDNTSIPPDGIASVGPSASGNFTGVIIGTTPLQWEDNGTVQTASSIEYTMPVGTVGTDSALTIRMEYQAQGGAWLPYDEKFAPVFSTIDNIDWTDWGTQLDSEQNWSIALDPRPSLFGMYTMHGGATSAPQATVPASSSLDLGDNSFLGLHGWHGATLQPFQLAQNTTIADRDGIIRPGMVGEAGGATENPLTVASGNVPAAATNADKARPIVLNRPFNSVADLGYVFSGMPWRNLDQSSRKSGFSRLLDVFTVNDLDISGKAIVNGKVDLNTRQAPVLAAIVSGAIKDEYASDSILDAGIATAIAQAVVDWTKESMVGAAATAGPLIERSDLVARYDADRTVRERGVTSKIAEEMGADSHFAKYQEASVRALANNGQTRVWNFMVDLVAQSGRYGAGQTDLAKFIVEGERRVWIHLAVDRFTGKVIDKQIEIVTE